MIVFGGYASGVRARTPVPRTLVSRDKVSGLIPYAAAMPGASWTASSVHSSISSSPWQAVSGLHRAFPLAYTRARLTGAERDIAATRGIGPQDRERLATAAVSALDGTDTEAARDVLAVARDRAAAALNFELAARIQEELAALAWVTSVQRVTVEGGGDHDVRGWADGLAVTFTVRGGRLNGWEQRACDRPATTGTPPEWAAFAQRNAELAAVLLRP